jgi:hypothetical protein
VPAFYFWTDGLNEGTDAVWSGYWGCFYRKFFWDMLVSHIRDPGGFQCVAPWD